MELITKRRVIAGAVFAVAAHMVLPVMFLMYGLTPKTAEPSLNYLKIILTMFLNPFSYIAAFWGVVLGYPLVAHPGSPRLRVVRAALTGILITYLTSLSSLAAIELRNIISGGEESGNSFVVLLFGPWALTMLTGGATLVSGLLFAISLNVASYIYIRARGKYSRKVYAEKVPPDCPGADPAFRVAQNSEVKVATQTLANLEK